MSHTTAFEPGETQLGLIESIRKWIDGESGEDLLEAADEHARPRRIWEEFLVKIARDVEAAMQL